MSNKKIYKNRLSLPIFDNKGIGNGNGVAYIPNVIRGGSAIPIGNNMFLMRGRSHAQGGIDIGKDLEVEGNEVVQNGKFGTKVFSSVPFLRGVSPAERVLRGENPDIVFTAQEVWKRIHKVADDGSKIAKKGGFVNELRKNLYASIMPANYFDYIGRVKNAILNPKVHGERQYSSPNREALWARYLNADNEFKYRRYNKIKNPYNYPNDLENTNEYIKESKYKPSIGKNNSSRYYSLVYPQIEDEQIQELLTSNKSAKQFYNGDAFGNYTLSKGRDKKGDYVSYYDKWDINPIKAFSKYDQSFGIGKPIELYDRMYLDDYYGVKQSSKDYKNKGDFYGGYLPPINVVGKRQFGGRIKGALGLSLFKPNSFKVRRVPINDFITPTLGEIETPEVPTYTLTDDEKPVAKAQEYARAAEALKAYPYGNKSSENTSVIDNTLFDDIKGERGFNKSEMRTIYKYLNDNGSNLSDYAKSAILATIAFESGANIRARNPRSTAKGYFQWLDDRYKFTDNLSDEEERKLQLQKIINDMNPTDAFINKAKDARGWTSVGGRGYLKTAEDFRKAQDTLTAVNLITRGHIRPGNQDWEVAHRKMLADMFYNAIAKSKSRKAFGGEDKVYTAPKWAQNSYKKYGKVVIGGTPVINPYLQGSAFALMRNPLLRTLTRDAKNLYSILGTGIRRAFITSANGIAKLVPNKYLGSYDKFMDNIYSTFIGDAGKDILKETRKGWKYYPNLERLPATINNTVDTVNNIVNEKQFGGMKLNIFKLGGLSRSKDYGSKDKPYPSVNKNDFAGGGRSYPIPTRADAVDALRLAGLHHRSDVRAKVYAKYPDLRKKATMGTIDGNTSNKNNKNTFRKIFDYLTTPGLKYLINEAKKPSYKRVAPSWITRTESPIFYDRNVSTKKGNFGNGRFSGGGAGTKFFEEYNPVEEIKRDTIFVPYETTFNDAFSNARRKGLKEFDFNGKKYNTELGDNPKNYEAGQQRKSLDFVPFIVERKKKNFVSNNEKKFGGKIKAAMGTIDDEDLQDLIYQQRMNSKQTNNAKEPVRTNYVEKINNDLATNIGKGIVGSLIGGSGIFGLNKVAKNYTPSLSKNNRFISPNYDIIENPTDFERKYNYPKRVVNRIKNSGVEELWDKRRLEDATKRVNAVLDKYGDKIKVVNEPVAKEISSTQVYDVAKPKKYTPNLSEFSPEIKAGVQKVNKQNLNLARRLGTNIRNIGGILGKALPGFALIDVVRNLFPSKQQEQEADKAWRRYKSPTGRIPEDYQMKFGGRKKAPYGDYITISGRRVPLVFDTNNRISDQVLSLMYPAEETGTERLPIDFNRLSLLNTTGLGTRGSSPYGLPSRLNSNGSYFPINFDRLGRANVNPTYVFDDVLGYTGNINGRRVLINPSYMRQVPRSVRRAVLNNTPEVVRGASSIRRNVDDNNALSNARPQYYAEENRNMYPELNNNFGLFGYGWSHNNNNRTISPAESLDAVNRIAGYDLSTYFNNNNNSRTPRRTQPVRVHTERVGNVPETYREFRRPNLTQLETRGIGLNMPAYENPFAIRQGNYNIDVPTTLDTSRLDSTLSRYGVTPISSSTGVQLNPADVEAVRSGNFAGIDNDRYLPIRTTTEDWVGLGANLLGSIGSYLGTRAMLNRYPTPNKPVPAIAQKLKTRVNINPQLDTIREQVGRLNTSIDNNTSSSRVAQARKQGVMNNAVASRNQLYGQKENAETQLINQDIMNRQRIGLYNNQIYNDYLNKLGSTRQYLANARISNFNNVLSGANQSIQDLLGRIENRDAERRNFIFMQAAYPNVNWRNIFQGSPELARSLGFRFV